MSSNRLNTIQVGWPVINYLLRVSMRYYKLVFKKYYEVKYSYKNSKEFFGICNYYIYSRALV